MPLKYKAEKNINSVFATLYGREYGGWIGTRGGHSEGDLIENPAGVIESIIRDEMLRELDYEVATYSSTGKYIDIITTPNRKTDFYQDGYIHNVSNDWVKKITYSSSSTYQTRIYVGILSDVTTAIGDKIFLTNVNANIDTTSFDTFETARSGWVFRRSVNKNISALDLLNELCYESHSILFRSNQTFKIVALESGTALATLGRPLDSGGVLFRANLVNPLNLYSDFRIGYNYDYGKGDYLNEIICNKEGSTSGLGSTYEGYCKTVNSDLGIERKYEYNLKNISDETTALNFAKKIIKHLTANKLVIWGTWSAYEAAKYEVGDLLKINYSDGMPSSENNNTVYMVKRKRIITKKRNPAVELTLMELP